MHAPVEVREEARADHLVGALGLLRPLVRPPQRRLRLGELVLLADDALWGVRWMRTLSQARG